MLTVLCCILFFVDYVYGVSDYLRPTVSSTLYRFFDTPSTWFIQQRYLWSDHHSLEDENKQLRKRVAELQVHQQQLMAQIQENKNIT